MEPAENSAPQTANLPPPPQPEATSPLLRKNPLIAGFLSGFPGMGHVYNGLYVRAVTFFLIVATCLYMTQRDDMWGFVLAFAWIFNILDAYRQANLINLGYAADLGLTDRPQVPKPGEGMLIFGIVLFVAGLLIFLDVKFHIDIGWILEFWPLGLMLLGAWFIYSWFRERIKGAT